MSEHAVLKVEGLVERPLALTAADLAAIDPKQQIEDVSQIDPKRAGKAVRFDAILEMAGVSDAAKFLGLHASADDFHASVPLEPLRERGMIIYEKDGRPLTADEGGPIRFYIRDYAACHTEDIDECANVKYVDRLELTVKKGFDNRPDDEEKHRRLHEGQQQQ